MNLYSTTILAELPADLPKLISIEIFSSDKISVLRAQNVFSEERSFDCQKFLISYSPKFPALRIKGEAYKLGTQRLFSISPGQLHSFEATTQVPNYNAIFIDNSFLREISKELFGITHIEFENGNNPVSPYLHQLFRDFIMEFQNKQPGYEFSLQALNIQIAVNLLRATVNSANNKDPIKKRYHDPKRVAAVSEYLNEDYTKNFSLDELAKEVNYSQFHLLRVFKAETGKTPFEYLRDLKVEKARELLQKTDKTITEICFESGFNNRSHFSSVFKKRFGIAPTEFRKLCDGKLFLN